VPHITGTAPAPGAVASGEGGRVDEFVQQLANGVTKGSYYALIALGYTMVYGIIQLINFAHGEVFMLGAFIGLWTFNLGVTAFGWGSTSLVALVVVLLAATLATPLVGVSLERFAYRPLRNAPRLAPLITALGASFALQQLVAVFYSRGQLSFPDLFPNTSFRIGGATIQLLWVFMVGLALLLTFTLTAFIRTTRLGKAMRATAEDPDTARLMGINVDMIIALTFIIGSALAGIGGVLAGMYLGQVNFFMGFIAGLKAFTAAVLGGIGNIAGAVLGAFLLGILETFGAAYLGGEWQDVFAFGVLILVLVFRPTGLLGERVAA
jgi:branched-chain amino acid transport system permease protein